VGPVRRGLRPGRARSSPRVAPSSEPSGADGKDNGSSPRPISTGRLKTLRPLHHRPINQVVYLGSYLLDGVGNLILGWASCLDAFSAYPFRTQLPSVCPWRDNWYTGGPSIPVFSYWGRLPSSFLRPRRIWTELSHDVLNPAHVPL